MNEFNDTIPLLPSWFCVRIAQLVEHQAYTLTVLGSSPSAHTFLSLQISLKTA